MQTYRFIRKESRGSRDLIIGRALSRAMRRLGSPDPCPSTEEIASFLDGSLSSDQRERLLGHFIRCERCFEILSTALALEESEEKTSGGQRWTYSAVAIAAVAFVILVIGWVIQISRPFTPLSSLQLVTALSKKGTPEGLFRAVIDRNGPTYGFGPRIPLEREAFRIGVTLLDLEVALRYGDRDTSLRMIKRLTQSLRFFDRSDELLSFYEGLSQQIEGGGSPEEFRKKTGRVDSFFEEQGLLLFLRFGEWAEAGRIAANTHQDTFFHIETVDYFIQHLQGKGLPQGVLNGLQEVRDILMKKEFGDKGFKRLERAFTDLIDIMS